MNETGKLWKTGSWSSRRNYGLFIIQKQGRAKLFCVVVAVSLLDRKYLLFFNGEIAHYLKTSVAPQIPPELLDSFLSAIEKGSTRTMTT
ncbi:hypothetical protein OIU78_016549 [Salix suchowensis]|nr:hypothetical protein OIU78_016549 [Salix suchowensis]